MMIKTTMQATWHPLISGEAVSDDDKAAAAPRIRKMCKRFEQTMAEVVSEHPYLRFLAVASSDKRPTEAMVFHSSDGITWVPQCLLLPDLETMPTLIRSFNRGAMALDGAKDVSTELSRANALLRLGYHEEWGTPEEHKVSLEKEIDEALAEVGRIYVAGSTTEEGRQGREVALETINRTIQALMEKHRRTDPGPYEAVIRGARISGFSSDILDADGVAPEYDLHVARQYAPFIRDFGFLDEWRGETKTERRKRKIGIWADAAGLPRDADFREIHGRLLAMSKGHPIFGDKAFERLSDILAEHLERGEHVVLLGGRLFMRKDGRWRAAYRKEEGEPSWTEGVVVSQNHGRLVIPPFFRDGALHDGYTRNGPGEGPSKPREAPVRWQIATRDLAPSDLVWVHALHDWDLAQA